MTNFSFGEVVPMKKVRTLIGILLLIALCIPLMAPRGKWPSGKTASPPATTSNQSR
jgi:hypothetical protein